MAVNYFSSVKKVRFYWIWTILVTVYSFAIKSFGKEKYENGSSLSRSSLPLTSIHSIGQPKAFIGDKLTSSINSKSTLTVQNTPLLSSSNQLQIKSTNETTTSVQEESSFISRLFQNQYRLFSRNSNRMQLVLDLDETLISSSSKHSLKHDISVQVYISGSNPSNFYIRKRPHVDHFLDTVSQWFELIIFTASISPYANAVIDELDPKRHISRRYYRQSCMNKGGNYVKDLKVVCKDLSKVLIIDNSPIAYSCNKENAIPIDDYIGNNSQDRSLLNLIPILEKIKDNSNLDVRQSLKLMPKGTFTKKNRLGS